MTKQSELRIMCWFVKENVTAWNKLNPKLTSVFRLGKFLIFRLARVYLHYSDKS